MKTTHNKHAAAINASYPHTQATNQHPKKLASKMLTKCLLIEPYLSGILSKQTASQKISKHLVSKMLTN
jgi:hypothetical protein